MIELVGHTLNRAAYNEDEQTLSLTIDNDKVFIIKIDADCCSVGKFIGISTPWGLPQKIVGLENSVTSFDIGSDEYQVYKCTYTLADGKKFDIVFDNYSNGYYGSSLDAYYRGERVYYFPKDIPMENGRRTEKED